MKTKRVETARASKKPYSTPRLTRYGDLKQLTGGGKRNRSEIAGAPSPGPKTRANTPA